MSPSVFVAGAVLGIIKCDSPKTTSFSWAISQQIILVSCIFFFCQEDMLFNTGKSEQQQGWNDFSSSSSHEGLISLAHLHPPLIEISTVAQHSKTSERFQALVSEAKCPRSASRILILFTYIIVNFLNNLHNSPSSCCMPTHAIISPCYISCFDWFLFFLLCFFFFFWLLFVCLWVL